MSEKPWKKRDIIRRGTAQTTTYFCPGSNGNVRFRFTDNKHGASRLVKPCVFTAVLCARNFKDVAAKELN